MPKLTAWTYEGIDEDRVNFEFLKNKLKIKNQEIKDSFKNRLPRAHSYIEDKQLDFVNIRNKSAKLIGTGALSGSLMLTPVGLIRGIPQVTKIIDNIWEKDTDTSKDLSQDILVNILKEALPEEPRPLSRNEEKVLENVFEKLIGIKTRAGLNGEHLNTTYGKIGIEQHLKRYPGDSLSNHDDPLREGIAPYTGAWGYFAKQKDDLTESLIQKEKWYAVVQTLYLPDWDKRHPYLREWYKYRKVLIVNTRSGNAVVAAIADSGPAAWTGKQFGGSPEVMRHLGGAKYTKGNVIIFFVDDPENKIPLGPVEYGNK